MQNTSKFDQFSLIRRCGGKASESILALDWSQTELGPIERWGSDLTITLANLLCSPLPALLFWGDQNLFFYNDAYLASYGSQTNPGALGKPASEVWPRAWPSIHPHIEEAKSTGHAMGEGDLATYSYSPAFISDGSIGGVFIAVNPPVMRLSGGNTADRAKADFLANISHEIRTPMTAILGFTDILRAPGLDKTQRQDAIMRIERSGRALLQLIDDVLDISRIESGKVQIERSRFSPAELITEIMTLLRGSAEKKNLQFHLSIGSSVPTSVYSDQARLRQVLLNLIGNAIKFTLNGEVSIRVDGIENRFLSFEVKDTGIGISQSDQAKLFRPFAQADGSVTRSFGGTGLGLSLSRRICERLGGSLELVKSEFGMGSVFVAQVDAAPFYYDQPATEEIALDVNGLGVNGELCGKQVLLAEDMVDNQDLMRYYLESAGVQVEIANNGEEAIQKATQKPYDLILMDIQMPRVDGIQATRVLRNGGYRHPILALTAHALTDDVKRSLEAGCDEHLTKPITQKTLVQAVARHLS